MSIESRLQRGDSPVDVAKLFGIDPEDAKKIQAGLKKPAKKKAARKKK